MVKYRVYIGIKQSACGNVHNRVVEGGVLIRQISLYPKMNKTCYTDVNRLYYHYYYFIYKFRIDRIREES